VVKLRYDLARCRIAEPVEGVFELGMEAVHRLAGK
jgi:hypothetical protein